MYRCWSWKQQNHMQRYPLFPWQPLILIFFTQKSRDQVSDPRGRRKSETHFWSSGSILCLVDPILWLTLCVRSFCNSSSWFYSWLWLFSCCCWFWTCYLWNKRYLPPHRPSSPPFRFFHHPLKHLVRRMVEFSTLPLKKPSSPFCCFETSFSFLRIFDEAPAPSQPLLHLVWFDKFGPKFSCFLFPEYLLFQR